MGSDLMGNATIFALLLLIVVMDHCGHCAVLQNNDKTHPKNLSSIQEQKSSSVVSASDSHLPIDPLLLLYLSDHLSPQECKQMGTLLVKSVSGLNIGKQNISGTPIPLMEGESSCFAYLKHWNKNILTLETDKTVKTNYAEIVIEKALRKIKRKDLRSWMKATMKQKEHDEVKKFNQDFQVTFVHTYLTPKTHLTYEEEEARSLHIINVICFSFFAGVGLGIALYICMSIWVKPKDYIPLQSSTNATTHSYVKNRRNSEYLATSTV